ncbi:MAG: OmpA family protein [Sedimenticola sp.]
MRRMTAPLLITLSLGLNGCISWPLQGSGGMAELRPGTTIPVEADQPLTPAHGLRFDLEINRRHLDVLVLEGAELCFPATVVQAKEREKRIARALYGGLPFDAANDLIIQHQLLARLERQLDYVRKEQACRIPVSPDQQQPGDMGSRINTLLNSDNQFALDSAELNPKYVGRLAEAAVLLRDLPGYQLRIVGHADVVGAKSHNQQLSMQRAEKVARYLQVLGLPKARIEVTAVASDHPLFEGNQPHERLVNRRVTIELIETASDTARRE